MNSEKLQSFVSDTWDNQIIDKLKEYIQIPNISPTYDKNWQENGLLDQVVQLAKDWVLSQDIKGLSAEILKIPGKTPLLFIEVAGQIDGTVMLYGHLDKQPPFEGWREGLGPYEPVIENGRLYGRGAADDGYAVFASMAAVKAVQEQGIPHQRIVGIIECSEESGSPDLPAYMNEFAEKIGSPELIICLDSGAGDYKRLWNTTSLRGVIGGELKVRVLTEGVHSGEASGVVASSFRIIRQLLNRLEDPETGEVLPPEFKVDIPDLRKEQAHELAELLGDSVYNHFPFVEGMQPVETQVHEIILNRTWRPALSITGQSGLPDIDDAGNVLRPGTSVKLSLRIPPSVDAHKATKSLKELLEKDPPYKAHVEFRAEEGAEGWSAPEPPAWLTNALESSSEVYFENPMSNYGEGGTIPFMSMLGETFPCAQFVVTGVLGPNSNAHGPNEFLDIQTAKNITATAANLIAESAKAA